jgi:hypothetical protein
MPGHTAYKLGRELPAGIYIIQASLTLAGKSEQYFLKLHYGEKCKLEIGIAIDF